MVASIFCIIAFQFIRSWSLHKFLIHITKIVSDLAIDLDVPVTCFFQLTCLSTLAKVLRFHACVKSSVSILHGHLSMIISVPKPEEKESSSASLAVTSLLHGSGALGPQSREHRVWV